MLKPRLCYARRTAEEGRVARLECLQKIQRFQVMETNASVVLIKCKGLF